MIETLHGYRILRSGNLSLLYRHGEIRQVCLGRIQVLNAIYAAVRDQNWTTIPFTVVQETLEEDHDGFTIEIDLEHSSDKVLYRVTISIEAKGNQLTVNYKGTAGSSFLRNRIGLCILHPIKECRGEPILITHPEGSTSEGHFPELISPDQPFFNISGMHWTPGEGITAKLSFEGEIFESEDQRNWTDASYKTYGTPLERTFPVQVQKGDEVHQSVSLVVEPCAAYDQQSIAGPSPSTLPLHENLTLHPGKAHPLPGLGIGRSTKAMPVTQQEAEILSTLPFHHYRVDLQLAKHGWEEVYNSVAMEQKLLGWPLELVLHFGRQPGSELDKFLEHYSLHPLIIKQLLVFDQDFLSPNELLKLVIPRLRADLPDIQLGGGTDANFAELNRNPPDPAWLDFVSFSICPQIHAFDNLTMVENLVAQPDSVLSARSLLSLPVSIGALTLKQRFNPVATDEDEASSIPESDSHQHTSFAAGWTLGSLRNLTLAGPVSITYFETVGPRGILSRQSPPRTHSPLFHLFKELVSSEALQMIPMESSHPLEFDGLALQGEKENKWLIANYTETPKTITLLNLPLTHRAIFSLEDGGWSHREGAEPKWPGLALRPFGIYKIVYTP